MRSWIGIGGLGLVLAVEACRGPAAPQAPDPLDATAAAVSAAGALSMAAVAGDYDFQVVVTYTTGSPPDVQRCPNTGFETFRVTESL